MKQTLATHNQRLQLPALHTLHLLNTISEEQFNRVIKLARHIFEVPIAVVSFQGANRQWYKADDALSVRALLRAFSLCQHLGMQKEFVHIPDTLADEDLISHPVLKGTPQIRFFAGFQVKMPDETPVGCLCLIDHQPRHLNEKSLALLVDLAAMVEAELSLVEFSRLQQEILAVNETLEGEISVRKSIHEELQKQRAFLRQVIDINPHFIFARDREGRFTLVNEAFANMYGANPQEMIGKTDNDFDLDPEFVAQYRRDDLEVMQSLEEKYIPELEVNKGDGQVYSWQVRKRPIVGEDGQARQVLGVVTDITDRVQAEQERDRLFNLSVDMLAVGGVDGYFKRINPAFEKTLGYSQAELLSKPIVAFVHPDDISLTKAELKGLYYSLETRRFELRFFCLDGSIKWLDWTAAPAGHTFYAVARDVTERKAGEAALIKARDQALELSRLKSDLLAKVSHELRTPLGAIIGFAEMIREEVYGPVTLEQVRVSNEIIDSTEYLRALVSDLLDQRQLEVSRFKLQDKPFSLSEMLESVQVKMQVLAQSQGLSLISEIASTLPEQLMGDPIRIRQVLVNLVGNAIKFTQTGWVKIHIFQSDETHWAIAVADSGPGIALKDQAEIFEPFGQVDGSVTREYRGTGLGLSIVKQLTEHMDGQITLESEPDHGSTFTITLPLRPVAPNTSLGEASLER